MLSVVGDRRPVHPHSDGQADGLGHLLGSGYCVPGVSGRFGHAQA